MKHTWPEMYMFEYFSTALVEMSQRTAIKTNLNNIYMVLLNIVHRLYTSFYCLIYYTFVIFVHSQYSPMSFLLKLLSLIKIEKFINNVFW